MNGKIEQWSDAENAQKWAIIILSRFWIKYNVVGFFCMEIFKNEMLIIKNPFQTCPVLFILTTSFRASVRLYSSPTYITIMVKTHVVSS